MLPLQQGGGDLFYEILGARGRRHGGSRIGDIAEDAGRSAPVTVLTRA